MHILAIAIAALAHAPLEAAPANARLPDTVAPIAQSIHLWLDPTQQGYRGEVVIDVDIKQPSRTIWLNARGLTVTKAIITGGTTQTARAHNTDETEGLLKLSVDKALAAGRATITIAFTGAYRDDLHGLYKVRFEDRDYLFTQFEALSAREAFPCFDEPGAKIPFSLRITHKKGDVAIANTRVTAQHVKGDNITTTYAPTQPLPTYLLAFTAGPLDVVQGRVLPKSPQRNTPLSLRGIAPKGHGHKLALSLERTADVVLDLERAFGVAYPYDKLDLVAVPDFSAGAMENAGLVTYRDTLLYVDDNSPQQAHKGNLGIIAHELAHQWFGNLVTLAWWDDLWLNEAFATWMAARSVHRLRPDFDGALRLRETAAYAMGVDALASARQIREPIKNRGDIDNAFDGITYSKGAAVIAMFEEWLDETKGKDTFMKGVRAYLLRYSHKNATAAQFLAEISRAANVDVATAFSTFLDQPGVPLVRAQCTVRDGKAVLAVNSERFVPNGGTANRDARFIFPVCAKVIDSGQVRCALIDKAGEIDLAVSSCPVVHPNADGAGYYRFTMPASEQGALLNKLDKLTSGEKLAAAQSLQAAFATASSSLRDVVDAASPLATEKDASLATTPLGFLHFARERLGGDNAAKANARIIVLYSRQLRSLGLADKPGEDAKDVDRRAALVGALWEADPTLRAQLAKEGKAWLDAPHDRLAKDIVSRALHAYVRNDVKDAATWDALLARAKREPDLRVRGWLLWALASVREPALSPKALAMLDDVDLRVNERVIGLWAQGGDTHTAKNTFDFVQKNYADIAQKIPEQWRQRLPAGGGVCSDADADAMHAFFSPKIPEVSGLERSLAQAVEGVRLCAARVRDHRRGL